MVGPDVMVVRVTLTSSSTFPANLRAPQQRIATMADRRSVRSSSRRTTPAPQLLPKAIVEPPARTTRHRRSASRDVEEPLKPTRRSARQASVESIRSENEAAVKGASRAKRKVKEAIAGELRVLSANLQLRTEQILVAAYTDTAFSDLTVVEEGDTQVPEENASVTQPEPIIEATAPRRSLGAVSSMSGTTAISSFTFVEGETLNVRFIMRHLLKLHDEAVELLNHLAPEDSEMRDLHDRIEEMENGNSDFVADYEDFNSQLSMRLAHYRGESQQYIHIRAIHTALFGPNRDIAAAETGLDLLLYQANLAVFAKDMINTDRNDKNMVGILRGLDSLFPVLFLPALILGTDTAASPTGDSALLQATFELALDLRTQLAILYLVQGSADQAFDPIAALQDVFFELNLEDPDEPATVRGWDIFALGGNESTLPEVFAQKVEDRVADIRQNVLDDEGSQEERPSIDIESLCMQFPWKAVILRLLGWVRDRNVELEEAVRHYSGAAGISQRIKAEREHPTVPAETDAVPQQTSPRKSRTSFGRGRRRSSKKFDPNAEIDADVLKKLVTMEGEPVSQPNRESHSQEEPHAEEIEAPVEAVDDEPVTEPQPQGDENDRQLQEDPYDQILGVAVEAGPDNETEELVESTTDRARESRQSEVPNPSRPTQALESLRPTKVLASTRPPSAIEPLHPTQDHASSQPPRSTNDFVRLLKEKRPTGKENRAASLFDRQVNAQRVLFGDGFDSSEPTPGPSTREPAARTSRKGKEPLNMSPQKRKRSELTDDDDSDFDRVERSANVERQRAKAPKRVRREVNSSGAPSSHQPRLREGHEGFEHIDDFPQYGREEPSEGEAPDMIQEAPPRSTYQDQVALARTNTLFIPNRKPRRVKKPWTFEEENALAEYMAEYPKLYSTILKVDKQGDAIFYDDENGELVERRTQVDLKDKARVMAKNMIK